MCSVCSVFLTDVRIVVQDLLLGPSGGKKIYDELDGEPCAFDDRLPTRTLDPFAVDRDVSRNPFQI